MSGTTRSRRRLCPTARKALATGCLFVGVGASAIADDDPARRVSGPYSHENLSVYLVHDDDEEMNGSLVPLDEALKTRKAIVHETGAVTELAVENVSETDRVFIQAGDIVKGGQQDRVLSVDLILPPKSGRVSIAALCVEQGRWRRRGAEDPRAFHASGNFLSSRMLKMATRREKDQRRVWEGVAEHQLKLGRVVKQPVAAALSPSSLQLSLENSRVAEVSHPYEEALRSLVDEHADAVGFGFAINGEINSAEVYATHELFVRLWPKLLAAAAREAVSERSGALASTPPAAATLSEFLAAAERGSAIADATPATTRVRETDTTLYFESRADRDDSGWVHRSYFAK